MPPDMDDTVKRGSFRDDAKALDEPVKDGSVTIAASQWPPLDEKGRVPEALLEAEWLALAHRVMAQLHLAKAESGASWKTLALRLRWPVRKVKRGFWDPEVYRGLKIASDMCVALGCRMMIGFKPVFNEAMIAGATEEQGSARSGEEHLPSSVSPVGEGKKE